MSQPKQDRKLIHYIAGGMLARYLRLVRSTGKMRSEPSNLVEHALTNAPCICAVWHGQFLLVPTLNEASMPWRVLVARHGDAEAVGVALEHFDMKLIRGAGAGLRKRDRGGAMALRHAMRALEDGCCISMTVETPPGPARKVGMGIITLARLSGRPILPCAVATSRYAALNTWSRFVINLPFSRIGAVLGDPIYVPREAQADELERLRQNLEQSLFMVNARAYQMADGNPARSLPPHLASTRPPGFTLKSYRALTSALRTAAPLILSRRERRNKEDPSRRDERFGRGSEARPPGPLVWVHAASVGETNAILPTIQGLKARRPDLEFLLTTGTVTSAQLASERAGNLIIHQYVPLDAVQYVRRFLDHWAPDIAIFTESEVWPNLILETASRSIPMALVNGRLSAKSFRAWRRQASVAQQLFGNFNVVLAQSKAMARRFSQLGAKHVFAVGNIKLDAPPPPVDLRELKCLSSVIGDRTIFVAASTHAGEDEVVAKAHQILKRQLSDILTIVIPRHPERGSGIAEVMSGQNLRVYQRSVGLSPDQNCDVYLADTIGEIGTFYTLASVAFVGGSLVPHGGQNPIEAIKLGCGVLIGPHWQNFKDVYGPLVRASGCREVCDAEALASEATQLLQNPRELRDMNDCAVKIIEDLGGALEETLEKLEHLLPGKEGLRRAS